MSTIPASSVLATMMMTAVPMISERTHIMMAVTVAMTGTVSGMTVAVATMMTNMPMFSMPPAGIVMSMMLAAVAMVAETGCHGMMSLASAMPARHTMMPVTATVPGLPKSSVAVTVVPMTMAPMPVETGHHSARAPVTAPTVVAQPWP